MRGGRAAIVPAVAVIAVALLAGCTGAAMPTPGDVTAPPLATAAPVNGSTLQPAPAATGTPVDPTGYATVDEIGSTIAGVDFDSADHNLHCGIYDPYGSDGIFATPFAGCVPDQYDFVFAGDSPLGPPNSVFLEGTEVATAKTTTDVEFPGQDPAQHPDVRTLPEDHSITWSTVTCLAIENGIRCTNTATQHGFFLSRIKYQLF